MPQTRRQSDHAYHYKPDAGVRLFALAAAINLSFVAFELYFGFVSNSLSLIADAGHNAGDVLGLLLSMGALWLSKRTPSQKYTYGLGRTSILSSLANGIILLIAIGMIVREAIDRFYTPQPVVESTMIWVALLGIVVNLSSAWLFMGKGAHHHHHHEHKGHAAHHDHNKDEYQKVRELNKRGAFLHLAADAAASMGVVLGGLAIQYTGATWVDPLISLMIAGAIAMSTWQMFRESFRLAVDAVPEGVDQDAVEQFLATYPGVASIHDLHIWPLSTTTTALTVHLVVPDEHSDNLLFDITDALEQKFGINHAAVQLEHGDGSRKCKFAP